MRCAVCGDPVPEQDLVWAVGIATCLPCHERRRKAGPRALVVMLLVFLVLAAASIGLMVWLFPEMLNR